MTHRIAIKDRHGRVVGEKEVVSYAGLLDLAHGERLDSVETTVLQLPSKDHESAIVRATVRTSRGTFSAIGDASPSNVTPQIAPHYIRMAETRAVARALRTAVNIGAVAIEELGNDFDVQPDPPPANDVVAPQSTPRLGPPSPAPPVQRNDTRASDQQRKYIYRLLQQRGIEGDAAREFVQRELGVPAVRDAPKAAVSALLDRMTAANHRPANGAANGHG